MLLFIVSVINTSCWTQVNLGHAMLDPCENCPVHRFGDYDNAACNKCDISPSFDMFYSERIDLSVNILIVSARRTTRLSRSFQDRVFSIQNRSFGT